MISSEQYIPWLSDLLGRILELLGEELNHVGTLFGAERSSLVLCSLLEHSLRPLINPMQNILQTKSTISPLLIIDIYDIVVEFSRNVVIVLSGCEGNTLLNSLTILFSGFSTYLETYGTGEGNYLQKQLQISLNSINFDSQADTLGLGDDDDDDNANANRNRNRDRNQFGGVNRKDGDEYDGIQGGGGNLGQSIDDFLDPIMCFESYAEKLVAAADAIYHPTQLSLVRGATLMGGLKIKPVCRALSLSLSVYTKQLAVKINNLRIACGFNSETETFKSLSGNGNGNGNRGVSGDKGERSSNEDKAAMEHAVAVAVSWSRRLEGLDMRGRVLVPAALRSLQVRHVDVILPFLPFFVLYSSILFYALSFHFLSKFIFIILSYYLSFLHDYCFYFYLSPSLSLSLSLSLSDSLSL